jgi:predicted transcriptional regulator
MVGERDPKGIPMFKILAYLNKKKEAKSITKISEEADIPYNTVRDNIYKLLALGAIETKDGRYIITEKGKQMLDEFFEEIERLKEMVDA